MRIEEPTAMPLSLETLARYRAAHADGPESRRVWLFHSHVYFDHAAPDRVEEARAFMAIIRQRFAATAHVEVHSLIPFPAGPHPRGSFEVLFTREVFAEYVLWLMFTRPESLDILVHPLTRSQTLDHTQRAFWLGTPLAIDRAMLEAVDARLLATGRTEESIIDGTKKHLLRNCVC
jgi:aromatic ring-cleaving dioxygenase